MSVSQERTATASPAGLWSRFGRWLPGLTSLLLAGGLMAWADPAASRRVWTANVASLAIGLFAMRRSTFLGRVLGWSFALVVVALGPRIDCQSADLCGAIGAAAAVGAACVAMVRIPAAHGIVRTQKSSAIAAVSAAACLWTGALVIDTAPVEGRFGWIGGLRSLSAASGAAIASVASALLLLAQTEWTLRRRRLQVGIAERFLAIRSLLWATFCASLLVAAVGHAEPALLAWLTTAAAGVIAGAAALQADAVRVARIARRVVVLAISGGSVAWLGASIAGASWDPWWVTLWTGVVVLAFGALAPLVEAPLRPGRGLWLDAFARAIVAASRAEPDDAIRDALLALRTPAGLSSPSPELWTLAPARVTRVDAAGYLHDRDAELPESLIATAAGEPEGTLRAEVLDALEVRRPELRALSKWMADRDASLAAVVGGGGETEGILIIPRGKREEAPTLEEIRALRHVADFLAAACKARAGRARMLSRMIDACERAEAATDQLERLRHDAALGTARHVLATTRLARPATVGVYSAASRMALEGLERRTAVGAPVAVVAPNGVDPVPYLARAHLGGARRDGALVVVEGTAAREHDAARWCDPQVSPLALADRGMLLLLDGAALPADIQQLVARSLAEKRTPWERPEPLDVELAFAAVAGPEELVANGRLDPALALRLGDASASPIGLPRLRDRVEDLRAIITDRLAREGLRVLGHPVGIEQAAYARLIEYAFPGEDAELTVVVQRLVSRCRGEVVRVADVNSLSLVPGARGSVRHTSTKQRKSPLSA